MRDVITGEAVVVELPLAQLASRSLAFAIDAGLVLLVYALILLGYALTGLLGSDPAFAPAVIIGTAGTEQKGPHMVDGEHKFVMEYAADKIARALGKTLVAPIVVSPV